MSHRLIPALLCALMLAAAPATAAAQAPPDERANARALADIGIRLTADVEAAASGVGAALEEMPTCKSERRLSRATERQQARAIVLIAGQVLGILGRAVSPALDRATAEMQAVPTADPALQGGRTAWLRIGRIYGTFAKLRHVRLCTELRDYVRGGFKPTPAIRRATKTFRRAARVDTENLDRLLASAVQRLVELGVPADEAAKFGGDSGEGDGEAWTSYAPAPSSPLKLLRAAS